MPHRVTLLSVLLVCIKLVACGGGTHTVSVSEHRGSEPREWQANVDGWVPTVIRTERGRLNVETEYVPGVVACEIGKRYWGVAAMEAQAIAARTYLARYLERTKGTKIIPIGPRFQCWKRTTSDAFRQAALATSGQVLTHQGRLITGNYVSGTNKIGFDCLPDTPGSSNYEYADWQTMLTAYKDARRTTGRTPFRGTAWTEIFVTRNEGRRGVDVVPSPIANKVKANRGAFGQNAAVCLANNLGYETLDILKYFYGDDIKLER